MMLQESSPSLPSLTRRIGAPRLATIIEVVASEFEFTPPALMAFAPGGKRHDRSHARFFIVWLARELTGLSYPQIAERLGYAEHTAAIHGKATVDRWIATDPTLRPRLDMLAQRCTKESVRGS